MRNTTSVVLGSISIWLVLSSYLVVTAVVGQPNISFNNTGFGQIGVGNTSRLDYFYEEEVIPVIPQNLTGNATTETNITAAVLFGREIALNRNGSIMVVGAPSELDEDTGAVFIFIRPDFFRVNATAPNATFPNATAPNITTSNWTQVAYIKPTSLVNGDEFGTKVATSAEGTVIVATAPQHNSTVTNATTNSTNIMKGAVYVVEVFGSYLDLLSNNNTNVTINPNATAGSNITYAVTELQIPEFQQDHIFGYDVAISGDGSTIVVGLWNITFGPTGGFAYIYQRNITANESQNSNVTTPNNITTASNWTLVATLQAPTLNDVTLFTATFGFAVGTNFDGSDVLVSATTATTAQCALSVPDGTGAGCGAVYVFRRNATDDGDDNDGGGGSPGSQPTWSFDQLLAIQNPSPLSNFGNKVVVNTIGNASLISTTVEVFVFIKTNDTSGNPTWLQASDGLREFASDFDNETNRQFDSFSIDFDLTDDANLIIIGDPSENDFSGAVYLYAFDGVVWLPDARIVETHVTDNDDQNFGLAVAIVRQPISPPRDIDGEEDDDVASGDLVGIGAPLNAEFVVSAYRRYNNTGAIDSFRTECQGNQTTCLAKDTSTAGTI